VVYFVSDVEEMSLLFPTITSVEIIVPNRLVQFSYTRAKILYLVHCANYLSLLITDNKLLILKTNNAQNSNTVNDELNLLENSHGKSFYKLDDSDPDFVRGWFFI
jgi:hypothetical protein